GTCEAVAFGLAGYRTTGVALPLINYHNVGPDHAIEPEIIDVRDFLGEVQLLVAAVDAAPLPYTPAREKRLLGQVARYRRRPRALGRQSQEKRRGAKAATGGWMPGKYRAQIGRGGGGSSTRREFQVVDGGGPPAEPSMRDLRRRYAGGVCVVTARDERGFRG